MAHQFAEVEPHLFCELLLQLDGRGLGQQPHQTLHHGLALLLAHVEGFLDLRKGRGVLVELLQDLGVLDGGRVDYHVGTAVVGHDLLQEVHHEVFGDFHFLFVARGLFLLRH